jgi:hypothetical protein
MTKLDKATEKADDYQKNQPNRTWKGENENTEDVKLGSRGRQACLVRQWRIFSKRRPNITAECSLRSAGEPGSFTVQGLDPPANQVLSTREVLFDPPANQVLSPR